MLKKRIFAYKNKYNDLTEKPIDRFYKNKNIGENSSIDSFYIWRAFKRENPNRRANILQNIWINWC